MAQRVVVFGGNGFVGSRVLKLLAARAIPAVSVSRTGAAPAHLAAEGWAQQVEWRQGDALDASTYADVLHETTAVVSAVGYAPLPWLDEAFAIKVNGETNATVIREAGAAGVPRVVLVNATMPRWAPAGYVKGKQLAEDAAAAFANEGELHGAVVLKPGAIFGTRRDGPVPLPLGLLLAPVSWALRAAPGATASVAQTVPSLLEGALVPPASVDNVAQAAVDGATQERFAGTLTVVDSTALALYHNQPQP